MGGVIKFLKRFYSYYLIVTGNRGFTLVEVTASIAVIATLVAIALPLAIDKIDQAKKTTADGDTKDIATAVTQLIYDVGLDNLGKRGSVVRLALTSKGGRDTATDPLNNSGSGSYNDAGAIWSSTKGGGAGWSGDDVGSFHGNLVVNDLNGNGTLNETDTTDYPSTWKGPYISEPKVDPWGRSYVANLQGMRAGKAADGTGTIYGWVLSAGPNNKLETDDESTALVGDDRGIMLFKR
ncbi:MAG TPA: type II secretion system protein [Candidatus Hypogeohydataceae bacterium YC41]